MVFSDPEIVELLSTKFVPLALDAWYHRRRQDSEGEFLRKVIGQEPTRTDMKQSTQGRYAFTADGRLFGFDNHGSEGLVRTKLLLKSALARFEPARTEIGQARPPDPLYDRTMPPGVAVVDITMKFLGGYAPTEDPNLKAYQGILGRERLWIRKDETEALSRGEWPESLKRRLVLAHLYDNTRGQHNAWWKEGEIRTLDLSFKDGRLRGSVHLKSEGSEGREFRADLLGFIEVRDGRLARFDLVVKGGYTEGHVRGDLPDVEPGAPFAMAFRTADPKDPGYKVPPACARFFEEYLR